MIETEHTVRQRIRQGWERTSAQYAIDRSQVFQRFAERLVTLLNPLSFQRVLDVGTGTGLAARLVAGQIMARGQVIGVDCAWSMAEQARTACAEDEWSNVFFIQMDAESLAFADETFDLVTCAFSLFQFVNMSQSLAEMRRVLGPGGRIGLSNWGPGFFSPVARMQRNLFREYDLRPLITNPITLGPEEMRALLEQAGFVPGELIQEPVEFWFATPGEIWDWNLAMGPFPIMLEEQLSASQRQELERRYVETLTPLMTPEGIVCTFHPLYAVAFKPENG